MVLVYINGMMEKYMKEDGNKVKGMDMENIKESIKNMKDNSKMICIKDKEH